MANRVQEITTDRIIEKMDEGFIPWVKPWFGLPTTGNIFTKRPYGIINQCLVQREGGYMSYKQFKENNVKITADCPENLYKIDKWEKGKPTYRTREKEGYHKVTTEEWDEMSDGQKFNSLADSVINYWRKQYQKKDEHGDPMVDKDGNPVMGAFPPCERYVNVLWAGFTDHDYKMPASENKVIAKPQALIEYYVNREGIDFQSLRSDEAYFSPSKDAIRVPLLEQFKSSKAYYGTAFHEMTHSTGVSKRLDRDMKGWFGDPKYAKEELVAELGSAFLCNRCGFEPEIENTAAYIQSWLRALKNDKSLIFTASAQAGKAMDFIFDGFENFEEIEEPEEPKEEPKPKKRTRKTKKTEKKEAEGAPKPLFTQFKKVQKDGLLSKENGKAIAISKDLSVGIITDFEIDLPEHGQRISDDAFMRLVPRDELKVLRIDFGYIEMMKKEVAQKSKQLKQRLKAVVKLPNGAVIDSNRLITILKALNTSELYYLPDKPFATINTHTNTWSTIAITCPIRATTDMYFAEHNGAQYGYIA